MRHASGPLIDTFSLPTSAVLIVFSGDCGKHIQHHPVHGIQYAAGKYIAGDAAQYQMTGWQIKTSC